MKSEESFRDALSASQSHVARVATWLQGRGCNVLMWPTSVRPSFEQRNEYADCGDIEMRMRVEVKQKGIEFTCADDYPYATVIVDEVFKVDRIQLETLWGYIILSSNGHSACRIAPGSKPHWGKSTLWDKKDRQYRDFYVCPKEKCTFYEMEG